MGGQTQQGHYKPWMGLPDAHFRCYRCGYLNYNLTVLAVHEDLCTGKEPDEGIHK